MSDATIKAALARLADAETELRQAKLEHEQEFRRALVDLYNTFKLSVEANGCEGCRLEIHEITHIFNLEMLNY